jgi:hypothetical protein
MKRLVHIGISLFMGTAFASVLLLTYYAGFQVSRLSGTVSYVSGAGFAILMPILLVFVANLKEIVKKIVVFAATAATVGSSYYVMLTTPNFVIPDFTLDSVAQVFFFVALGSAITVCMIAISETVRLSRDTKFYGAYLGSGFGLGALITSVALVFGGLGWLYLVMVTNYALPAGLLAYFLVYPTGKDGEKAMHALHAPETIVMYYVHDTSKGWKLALFTLVTAVSIVAMTGINGLALPQQDWYSEEWIFYIFAAISAFLVSGLAWHNSVRIAMLHKSAEKELASQVPWLFITIVEGVLVLTVVILEFFANGFHGSVGSMILDGVVFGILFGCFYVIVAIQHPPKSLYMESMFLSYFILFSLVLGSFLKVLGLSSLAAAQTYVMYVLIIAFVLLGFLAVLQLITMGKRLHLPVVPREPEQFITSPAREEVLQEPLPDHSQDEEKPPE